MPGRTSRRTYGLIGLGTLVAVVVLGSVLHLVLGGHHSSSRGSAVPSASPEPLLPGAPALVNAPRPSAATVPPLGFDVSHPQCGSPLPTGGGYAIVGIARGKALTANPCLKTQLAWANGKPGHAVYLNTGYPGDG